MSVVRGIGAVQRGYFGNQQSEPARIEVERRLDRVTNDENDSRRTGHSEEALISKELIGKANLHRMALTRIAEDAKEKCETCFKARVPKLRRTAGAG